MKDTIKAPFPTYEMMTTIGYQEKTVTLMAVMRMLVPLSTTIIEKIAS